MKMGKENQYK